ncbi:hypothetical protein RY831_00845 [Noviherbaspirillum sp. CPCC 100848]|uniref:Sodium/calcium exchanger membrane region domain-containing protein n=1 Tax=Noviherbaspirillum album TaxID=3080276 RepID=A0ABU6J2B3_9BURK|nr:hypothetical protein [Noviherbaspirillum sp. CPCC 100848]MEC4717690.1 hypothetical protein [Noviherbaspirillum sp. CPCC 100848]
MATAPNFRHCTRCAGEGASGRVPLGSAHQIWTQCHRYHDSRDSRCRHDGYERNCRRRPSIWRGTSLPELVTTIAAVHRGALILAVSDIVGGNFFDALFVAAADRVFLGGSVYHAAGIGASEEFLTILAILLNLVLLPGLLFRQRSGPGNIGLESLLMLVIYVSGFSVLLGFSWD